MRKKIPFILLIIYLGFFIWSAIRPIDLAVWRVEALTSAIPIIILGILYLCRIRFSNLAYILCLIFPVMHIIGAHYTFAEVPFAWFDRLIGSSRDMYDRVAHAMVGLYSFAIMESLLKYKLVTKKWIAYTYAIFFIMALAMSYELFEWLYAVSSNPSAGAEVLGSQGDIWDAQKDMLMDTIGALVGFIIFCFSSRRKYSLNKD